MKYLPLLWTDVLLSRDLACLRHGFNCLQFVFTFYFFRNVLDILSRFSSVECHHIVIRRSYVIICSYTWLRLYRINSNVSFPIIGSWKLFTMLQLTLLVELYFIELNVVAVAAAAETVAIHCHAPSLIFKILLERKSQGLLFSHTKLLYFLHPICIKAGIASGAL